MSYNRFVELEREKGNQRIHGHKVFKGIAMRGNFIINAVSALAAYCFFPKKPAISLEHLYDNQLTLF